MPDFAVRTAFTAVDKISPAFNKMGNEATAFQKTASRAFMAIGTLVSGYLINSFIEAAASAERMNVAFGSVFGSDAASQMGFVRDEAKRLGLDLQASADAYKSISAAAKGSAISNAMVKEVFIGVSEGAAALQLSSEQTSGALTALSQMISKGKVQAEELRGQLGERIPGAFQIAARAMNMTTSELDKFMSDGKLTAELFIPRFAAQMRKEFGPAAMDAANSFSAARNRFNNSVFDFKVGVGSVLLPALSDLMLAFMPVIDVMGQFFRENREGISAIIKLVPWLVGGFIAWKGILIGILVVQKAQRAIRYVQMLSQIADMMIISGSEGSKFILMLKQTVIWQKAVAIATTAWSNAQKVINFLLFANPIGIVIVAVAALGYAIYDLYKNWDIYSLNFKIGIQEYIFQWKSLKFQVLDFLNTLGMVSEEAKNASLQEAFKSMLDLDQLKIDKFRKQIARGDTPESVKIMSMGKTLEAPNRAATELQAGNTNVNIYSNGTEAKAEVTPRRGATVNMNRLGYQQ